MSHKDKRQFRRELRLAELPVSERIQVGDLTDTLRVALVISIVLELISLPHFTVGRFDFSDRGRIHFRYTT